MRRRRRRRPRLRFSDGKPRGKANRTLDLAAAPAGDLSRTRRPRPGGGARPDGGTRPDGGARPGRQVRQIRQGGEARHPREGRRQSNPRPDQFAHSGSRDRRLWRDAVRRGAKSGRRRSMAGRRRHPPHGAAADLRHHRQHHLQCRARMGAWRLFARWGRQGERRNRRRAIVGRFQDRRSVQLAGAGNRPHSDRLHQRASRADAVLQRAAAGNIQRPHPFDLDGPGEQRLWLDRRRTGLSDHGVEQPRGFRRRLQHAHGRQHRASISDRLSRRDHRPRCARLGAADHQRFPAAQQHGRGRGQARLLRPRRFRDSPEAPAPTSPRTRRRAGLMPTTARCSAVQA